MEKIKEKLSTAHSRFSDAPWFNKERIANSPVIIGGVGGIGSWTSIYLSRVGFEMHLYDDDIVEAVNMAGQLYSKDSINNSKVGAVMDILSKFSDNKDVIGNKALYEEDSPTTEYTFSCFDNMAARKLMFEKWVKSIEDEDFDMDKQPIFIDGRMEAEFAQIYFVTEDRIEKYRETLFNDDEVEDAPCSYKSTSHNGGIIGGLITSGFLNHIANVDFGEEYREVPFSIHYELPTLTYKTER